MKISIVTTLYNSAPYIKDFQRLISEKARELTSDYEIIMVNDGSPDSSLAVALELYRSDPHHLKIIDLSRNFGEHKAIMTGLANTTGDFVFLIQCDLEVSPSCLIAFWNDLVASTDTDLINGVQDTRRGDWRERIIGHIFYRLYNSMSVAPIGSNAGCRLMTRRFVDALVSHHERTVFLGGLCTLTGFGQKTHLVKKTRAKKSSYTSGRNIQMMVDAITSFSHIPLMFIFYLGCLILTGTILYIASILARKVLFGAGLTGWPSLMISIWFFGGLITASIGLVGIYLSRMFLEVKQRPYTIVKKSYGFNPTED